MFLMETKINIKELKKSTRNIENSNLCQFLTFKVVKKTKIFLIFCQCWKSMSGFDFDSHPIKVGRYLKDFFPKKSLQTGKSNNKTFDLTNSFDFYLFFLFLSFAATKKCHFVYLSTLFCEICRFLPKQNKCFKQVSRLLLASNCLITWICSHLYIYNNWFINVQLNWYQKKPHFQSRIQMMCAKLKQFFKVEKQISQIIFHLVSSEQSPVRSEPY